MDDPAFRSYEVDGDRPGRFRTWWDGGSLLITEARGYVDDDAVSSYFSVVDLALMESENLSVFHDWTEVSGHSVSAAARLLGKLISTRSSWGRIVIAIDHPIIAATVVSATLSFGRRMTRVKRDALFEIVRGERLGRQLLVPGTLFRSI